MNDKNSEHGVSANSESSDCSVGQHPSVLARRSTSLRPEKKTLLLVDDCKDQLTIFRTILENHQYRVLLANSAQEGLELLENEDIDLIVSDIMMPDMSGTEFLQVIRQNEKLKHLPVIMLTAGGADFKQTSLMTGADMFCCKASAAADLPRQIDYVLHLKS